MMRKLQVIVMTVMLLLSSSALSFAASGTTSGPNYFRALVEGENMKPIPDVSFDVVRDGTTPAGTIVSDQNGIIEYSISAKDAGHTFTFTLKANGTYTTTDTHTVEVGNGAFGPSIVKIDGEAVSGLFEKNLKYSLKSQVEAPVDKGLLNQKLDEAEKLKKDDFESGYEALQDAIAKATLVALNPKATQPMVNDEVKRLEAAIKALVKKKVPEGEEEGVAPFHCTADEFRATVVDKDKNPVKGVRVVAVSGDTTIEKHTDQKGQFTVKGSEIVEKVFTIKVDEKTYLKRIQLNF